MGFKGLVRCALSNKCNVGSIEISMSMLDSSLVPQGTIAKFGAKAQDTSRVLRDFPASAICQSPTLPTLN